MESKHPNVFICPNEDPFKIKEPEIALNVKILQDKRKELEKRRGRGRCRKKKNKKKCRRFRGRRRRKKSRKGRKRKRKIKKKKSKKKKMKIFRSNKLNPESSAVDEIVNPEQ